MVQLSLWSTALFDLEGKQFEKRITARSACVGSNDGGIGRIRGNFEGRHTLRTVADSDTRYGKFASMSTDPEHLNQAGCCCSNPLLKYETAEVLQALHQASNGSK